jgi:hypothetical protein
MHFFNQDWHQDKHGVERDSWRCRSTLSQSSGFHMTSDANLNKSGSCLCGGHAVAQLVEATRYNPKGCGFDSRWCLWNFSLTLSFQLHCGPGVDSASNRMEYQEYFLGGKGGRCVGLTTLPSSGTKCLEILEPHPSGTLRACPGL